MSPTYDAGALMKAIKQPAPPGSPYALPVPGTEREGRSPVYRHWRFQNGPLLETFHPSLQTFHDLFENSLAKRRNKQCLGWRPWNPATKTWEEHYVWMTYGEVGERRKNFGAGIVEVHQRAGITQDKYGVGLWAQNRPEWQITGQSCSIVVHIPNPRYYGWLLTGDPRSRARLTVALVRLPLRDTRARG